MAINWPSNTTEIIDEIRGVIGRNVIFVVEGDRTPCPTCDLDPITGQSINPFCPTCSGEGFLISYNNVTISGHVTWGFSELQNPLSGGIINEGDCRVQVKYTIANRNAIDSAKWVEVDKKKMQILKRTLRGVPTINRILVDLKERENKDV